MPGGGDPVRGGVWAADDGVGKHLLGATEGTGQVKVVRGGDGGRIFGGTQDDSEWARGRGNTDLENLVHGGTAADKLYALPGQGKPAELPGGGMPRTSGNKDSDAGPFTAPVCPGHHGHFGGGKTPPTTVTPIDW